MTMSRIGVGLAIAALIAVAAPWVVQAGEMAGMNMDVKGDKGPSSMAFAHANMMMHEGMAITYTGDADIDFVKGMIPHHQGAIEMAKIGLKFGKDPEVKKLAEGIIKAQEAEIAEMQAWLKARGQ
jgi:uncharacterized protein (DUF305 family)